MLKICEAAQCNDGTDAGCVALLVKTSTAGRDDWMEGSTIMAPDEQQHLDWRLVSDGRIWKFLGPHSSPFTDDEEPPDLDGRHLRLRASAAAPPSPLASKLLRRF